MPWSASATGARASARVINGSPLARMRRAALAWLALRVVRMFCRITVEGAEHMPRTGGAILVGNHVNPFEAPLIAGLLGRPDLWVVISEHLRQRPVLSRLIDIAYQVFWVNRMTGRADLLAGIPPLLAAGHIVAIPPEGRYSWNGRLGAADEGPALVALSTGAPILPVATIGLEALSSGVSVVRRPSVVVRFGPPFRLPVNRDAGAADIAAATATLMAAIACLLPAAQRGRWADRGEAGAA